MAALACQAVPSSPSAMNYASASFDDTVTVAPWAMFSSLPEFQLMAAAAVRHAHTPTDIMDKMCFIMLYILNKISVRKGVPRKSIGRRKGMWLGNTCQEQQPSTKVHSRKQATVIGGKKKGKVSKPFW